MLLFEIYVLTVGLRVHVSLHFASPFPRFTRGGRERFSVWYLQVTMEYRGQNRLLLNLLPKVPHIQQFLQHLNESVYS